MILVINNGVLDSTVIFCLVIFATIGALVELFVDIVLLKVTFLNCVVFDTLGFFLAAVIGNLLDQPAVLSLFLE